MRRSMGAQVRADEEMDVGVVKWGLMGGIRRDIFKSSRYMPYDLSQRFGEYLN